MGAVVIIVALALAQTPAPQKPAAPAPAAQNQPGKPAPVPAPPAQNQPAKPAPAPQPAGVGQTQPGKPAPAPAPAGQSQPAKPGAQPDAGASAQAPIETYTYRAEGRRDPFQSLLTVVASANGSRKGDGPGAMSLAEISVRGILQSRGTLVAMVQGPDNRTYIVHQGDKLSDGTIKTITPQGLVVVQEVNDPLSLVKQREVRKLLRSLEDAK